MKAQVKEAIAKIVKPKKKRLVLLEPFDAKKFKPLKMAISRDDLIDLAHEKPW